MQLHLLDATYELFRAHFGRPPHAGADGSPVGATLGVVESILSLLREDGVTHLGCATDHQIRSWRNDALRGLQDRRGHAARAAGPVPAARGCHPGPGRDALGDGRLRGGRRAGCGRGPLGGAPGRGAHRHPVAGQGHGPVRARGRPRGLLRPAQADVHGRGRRAGQVRRVAGEHPRLPGARGRHGRRLPRAARLGRGVDRHGAPPLPPPGGHPGLRHALGRERPRGRDAGHGAAGAPRGCAAVPGARDALGWMHRWGSNRPTRYAGTACRGRPSTALAGRLAAPALLGRVHRWAD